MSRNLYLGADLGPGAGGGEPDRARVRGRSDPAARSTTRTSRAGSKLLAKEIKHDEPRPRRSPGGGAVAKRQTRAPRQDGPLTPANDGPLRLPRPADDEAQQGQGRARLQGRPRPARGGHRGAALERRRRPADDARRDPRPQGRQGQDRARATASGSRTTSCRSSAGVLPVTFWRGWQSRRGDRPRRGVPLRQHPPRGVRRGRTRGPGRGADRGAPGDRAAQTRPGRRQAGRPRR